MQTFCVLDFETSSLNYYESDFKVISAALAWNDGRTEFILGQEAIGEKLKTLGNTPIIVYNIGFEQGVTQCVYNLKLEYYCDCQRLVQLYDNGGSGENQGFSLKNAVRRILKSGGDYEQEAYAWIRANVPGARRGKEGQHISQLPRDLLEKYNLADVENTAKLYHKISTYFREIKYDWTLDHTLYLHSASLIVDARTKGVLVNREKLQKDLESLENEVKTIDTTFYKTFAKEIETVREKLKEEKQSKLKKKILTELPEFNITSKKQLKMLFVDLLKLDSGFKTAKGSPSFKASHMGLYGSGGKLLEKRGKKLNHINQAKALLELSEKDGRWHCSLRAVGTSSGRFAGGS